MDCITDGRRLSRAAADFSLREFLTTEAAFGGILLLFNLLREFQRALRLPEYRQLATLSQPPWREMV